MATPEIRATQGTIRGVVSGVGERLDITQNVGRAIYNRPTDFTRITQAIVRAVEKPPTIVRAFQTVARAIIFGRIDDPKVRAWEFTLDGHSFYVLRLGSEQTLLFDLHSEQWYVWGSGNGPWRAFDGTNWLDSGRNSSDYGSQIVVGDDGRGVLWFLNPDGDQDEDVFEGPDLMRPFTRRITGQLLSEGYDSVPIYSVGLSGSIGDNPIAGDVTLYVSDDSGRTFNNRGTITVQPTDYDIELNWRSIGAMGTPGRLFRIEDTGALKRIDYFFSEDKTGG